jgi:hypothetical protein
MSANRLRHFTTFASVLLLLLTSPACSCQQAQSDVQQTEIPFSSSGTASFFIPSLNGNQIGIRIMKPEGDGPFPVLIGVAGGDGMYAFQSSFSTQVLEMGIMMVDFAPQGRGGSEGEDNYNGTDHQDDLKAIVDFVSELPFVRKDDIGILSYSYGLILATGALSRYPEMPIAFLIDWEGPACPGRDLRRGLENDEPWAYETLRFLNKGVDISPEELDKFLLHGGLIYDDDYWEERDAVRFGANLPCPYLRVQFDEDHTQGTYKTHMIEIINTITAKSGQWTRCNDNPPNIIYSAETLFDYHFHSYLEGEKAGFASSASKSVNTVLLGYVEEMFFSRPYEP